MDNNLNKNSDNAIWLYHTLIVIVLYNIRLEESITFQSINKALDLSNLCKKIDLLIYNNSKISTDSIDNIKSTTNLNIYYLHNPLNPGVSKAYNEGAELAKFLDKKFLFILDQDTILPINFPSSYQSSVTLFPNYPLYAPQVYSGNLLFSPCRYIFRKGSNFSSIKPGKHKLLYKNVLNSGLLVDLDAFRTVDGYDENVKLYFSDFIFFDRLKKYYKYFVVLDCRLDHQLSSVDYSNIEIAIKRFSYYCTGARQASRHNLLAFINQFVVIGIRSLLMSYRFKSFKFFFIYKEFFLGFTG